MNLPSTRTAIVLFNLGGPDAPEAVKPFLFNLFNDPAIIAIPNPMRWFLAKLISGRRAPIAREIYAQIGGRSPILPNTEAQARAIEAALGPGFKCFIAMRYWHPLTHEAVQAVKAWGPTEVVLLPLYPQYSTTTTRSSVKAWHAAARKAGLSVSTRTLCCYPREPGFVGAVATIIHRVLVANEARFAGRRPRLLFSAHGLPKKVVTGGDPYQKQVEFSVAGVVEALGIADLDWTICYQSRVGPLEWIGPATEAEIKRAGSDGVPIVIVPVAFVSEHSETLVELDIEYRHLAEESGVPVYVRAPTVDTEPVFIAGLADQVRRTLGSATRLRSNEEGRICPAECGRCAFAEGARTA